MFPYGPLEPGYVAPSYDELVMGQRLRPVADILGEGVVGEVMGAARLHGGPDEALMYPEGAAATERNRRWHLAQGEAAAAACAVPKLPHRR